MDAEGHRVCFPENGGIKVYVNATPWSLSKQRTDWLSRLQMAALSKRFPEVQLCLPQSWVAGVVPNAKHLWMALSRRLFRKAKGPVLAASRKCQPILGLELKNLHPDVILSQDVYPSNAGRTPVLWETFLIGPDEWLFDVRKEDRQAWEIRKELFARLGQRAGIIGLRGDYSVSLAQKMFPELAPKVRDLPFYLPDLESISEDRVIQKQQNDDVVRILFVGRLARLKGLPETLEAVSEIAQHHPGKVALHIISRFDDGEVTLPDEPWLEVSSELPWPKIQEMMCQSHVLIMPSRRESYGLVYLEGMAKGCVVVARDREPQREIVDYGKAGLLVNPDNLSDMYETLEGIVMCRDLRMNLALNGRRRFAEKYHWSVVGPMWVDAFNDCKGA